MVCFKHQQIRVLYILENFVADKARICDHRSLATALFEGISHRLGSVMGYVERNNPDVPHHEIFSACHRHESGAAKS